jgi:fructokinase/2-dehydro-3-deoxygluconokinase
MSAPRRRVVVLGDANVDLTLHVPARTPDGSRLVREPELTGGGTAANTATALARLGVPVEFAGAVGDDAFGRFVARDLEASGVGIRGLVTVDEPTCQVIAMIEPDGERSLVVWPPDGGALVRFRPEDVDARLVIEAAWLHTTGMCLRHAPVRDAVLAAMRAARGAGVRVSIDLNLRIELWGLDAERRAAIEAAIALADVVLGQGDEELLPLAGAGTVGAKTALDGAVEAAAARLAGGARTVVARLGAGGALACAPGGSITRSPAFPVEAPNPVGAGDAFNGGFVAAMVEGRPLAEALRWGNAVAALRVSRPGGARALPNRAEVEALLAKDGS